MHIDRTYCTPSGKNAKLQLALVPRFFLAKAVAADTPFKASNALIETHWPLLSQAGARARASVPLDGCL